MIAPINSGMKTIAKRITTGHVGKRNQAINTGATDHTQDLRLDRVRQTLEPLNVTRNLVVNVRHALLFHYLEAQNDDKVKVQMGSNTQSPYLQP